MSAQSLPSHADVDGEGMKPLAVIVKENERYLQCLARQLRGKYTIPGAELEDYISWGYASLLEAIVYYREDRGPTFQWFFRLVYKRRVIVELVASQREKRLVLNTASSLDVCLAEGADTYLDMLVDRSDVTAVDDELVTAVREQVHKICSELECFVYDCRCLGLTYDEIVAEALERGVTCLGRPVNYRTVDNALMRIKRKVLRMFT